MPHHLRYFKNILLINLFLYICHFKYKFYFKLFFFNNLLTFSFYQGGFDMICNKRYKIETLEQLSFFFFFFFVWLIYWLSTKFLCAKTNWLQMDLFFSLSKLKKQHWSLIWTGINMLLLKKWATSSAVSIYYNVYQYCMLCLRTQAMLQSCFYHNIVHFPAFVLINNSS